MPPTSPQKWDSSYQYKQHTPWTFHSFQEYQIETLRCDRGGMRVDRSSVRLSLSARAGSFSYPPIWSGLEGLFLESFGWGNEIAATLKISHCQRHRDRQEGPFNFLHCIWTMCSYQTGNNSSLQHSEPEPQIIFRNTYFELHNSSFTSVHLFARSVVP